MYRNGSLVTLTVRKQHHDGQDMLSLDAGTAGMIVQIRRGPPVLYVVDFGPYGQWNCTHEELSGEDIPGLMVDDDGNERRRMNPIDILMEEIAPIRRQVQAGELVRIRESGVAEFNEEENEKEDETPVIDFEADMARRVKELEKEIQ